MSNQPQQASSEVPTDDENQRLQLRKQVEELKHFNKALQVENEMFERFIMRIEQNQDASVEPEQDDRLQKGSGTRSPRPRQLTIQQKLHVSQMAIKEAQKDLEKLREDNRKAWDEYEASMEEAELCLFETRKAKREFEEKLLRSKNEKRLERKEPEKVLLLLTDKSKVTKIEMLSIKNRVLRGLRNKLKNDFQLKKENSKIYCQQSTLFQGEQKNERTLQEHLDEYVKTQHIITAHKEKLQSVTTEHTKLCQKIERRAQFLAKTEHDIKQAEREHLKAERLNRHLRSQIEDYEVPGVEVYQEARRKFKRLQQEVHTLERKVRIAQMTSKVGSKAQSSRN